MMKSPHNLPLQPTPLIGREREVHTVRTLLSRPDVRLMTLTGVAGTGKTRVGLQVAAESSDAFVDGVVFVGLAPIRDPALVAPTIGQLLGVRDLGSRPILESLTASLRERRLLLVLDNFEQILPAAPVVAELLAACPELKILVTSRAALHLRGEHEYPVPPLALPDPGHDPLARAIAASAAVALFVERATDVRPEFQLSDENATAVAEICRRLDGLPLALELAAPRVKLFSPHAMLSRLERRLPLLTGGARDLPARQQTLRDAIAWSYDLLREPEQRLFRRLGVFVGGFTLEAAEVVCGVDGDLEIETLDGVGSLVEHSLVGRGETSHGEPRFTMLETVREFALERLEASGEASSIRRRHRDGFLALAERAAADLRGPRDAQWFDQLEVEHGNLRAALDWSETEADGIESAARIMEALAWFWVLRSHLREAQSRVERLVAHGSGGTAARARLYNVAGYLAFSRGDPTEAARWLDQSLALWRERGDSRGLATALVHLGGAARASSDPARATLLFEESADLVRRAGPDRARDAILAAYTEAPFGNLSRLAEQQGDLARARALLDEDLAFCRAFGDSHGVANALRALAGLSYRQQDTERATILLKESLVLFDDLADAPCISNTLELLAYVATLQGRQRRAARLLGAAEVQLGVTGLAPMLMVRAVHDDAVAAARAGLGDEAFAAAWAEGRAMTLQQAVAYGLAVVGPDSPARPPDHRVGAPASPLSPREAEVAALIAQGLTNHQIGSTLVISERTVDAHVRHILDKLGFTSRAHVAAWAVRQGLVDDGAPRPDR
jgi:non-specific serine/threonine protein kinase